MRNMTTPIEDIEKCIVDMTANVKEYQENVDKFEFCISMGMRYAGIDEDLKRMKLMVKGGTDELNMYKLEKMIRVAIRDKKLAPIAEMVRKKYNDQCTLLLENLEEFGYIKNMTEGQYLHCANMLKYNRDLINEIVDDYR